MGKINLEKIGFFLTIVFFLSAAGWYVPIGSQIDTKRILRDTGAISPSKNLPQLAGHSVSQQSGRPDFSEDDWLDVLIEKIWYVESSGRINPPDGDNGRAGGPLQIHPCVVDDVNLRCGAKFTYANRYDIEKAKRIAKLYIAYWLDRQKEEIAARIFNGGPRGWTKESSWAYWVRIENQ